MQLPAIEGKFGEDQEKKGFTWPNPKNKHTTDDFLTASQNIELIFPC